MSLTQHHKVPSLRNILRRRSPMHPPPMRFAGGSAELPNQRYDGVAGARETFVDSCSVEQFQACGTRDCIRSRLRNDAEFRLRLGKCRLDAEPSLPAVFLAIERTNPRVRYPRGGREFIAHDGSSVGLGNFRARQFSQIIANSWGIRHRVA